MIPQELHIGAPPAQKVIMTGTEAEKLLHTAAQVRAKGRTTHQRITAPLRGEQFLLTLTTARRQKSGEVWHSATYASLTMPGRVRECLIDPTGQVWTLCPATERDPARALHMENKYREHLCRVSQQINSRKITGRGASA